MLNNEILRSDNNFIYIPESHPRYLHYISEFKVVKKEYSKYGYVLNPKYLYDRYDGGIKLLKGHTPYLHHADIGSIQFEGTREFIDELESITDLSDPEIIHTKMSDKVTLRPDQVFCITQMLSKYRGIIQAGTGCFTGSTEVVMTNNTTCSIEDLANQFRSNDHLYVLSCDPQGRLVPGKVLSAHKTKEVSEILKVHIKGSESTSVIECTPDHRFMTEDLSYTRADDLELGTALKSSESLGQVFVSYIEYAVLKDPISVYDLTIEDYENYVVSTGGTSGVVVHNSGKSEMMAGFLRTLYDILEYYPSTLVLVPTNVLVDNLIDRFSKYDIPITTYKSIRDHEELPDNKVIITHPKALFNDIESGEVDLTNVKVLLADECLPGSSNVLLPTRSATISEIYEDQTITEVVSYNTRSDTFEVKPIVGRYKSKYEDHYWRVTYVDPTTSHSGSLDATPNHKIWTCTRGYVELQDLTVDDWILVESSTPTDDSVDTTTTTTTTGWILSKDPVALSNSGSTAVLEVSKVRVTSISKDAGVISRYKYNLEVADNHNYFADNVLVSNCQHISCQTWQSVFKALPSVEYSLGMSAKAVLNEFTDISMYDYESASIIGATGDLLVDIPPSFYIDQGILSKPVLLRCYNAAEELITEPRKPGQVDNYTWHNVVRYRLESDSRDSKIIDAVSKVTDHGYKTLILCNTKRHAEYMLQEFSAQGLSEITRCSYGQKVFRRYDLDKCKCVNCDPSEDTFQLFEDGQVQVLIGTSHLYEGVDIPNLDLVVLASVGKSTRRVIQAVGRVIRKTKTGNNAYILDFTDHGDNILAKHSRSRLNDLIHEVGVEDVYSGDVSEIIDKFRELEVL